MDSVFGLTGDGFVILAADMISARSILVYTKNLDKIVQLDGTKLVALSGSAADSSNFSEYIQKNMKLLELENGVTLSTPAAANFIRGEMAKALRRSPFQTNLLVAGYDQNVGPSLYFIDYLGSLVKLNFGVHGYCSNFILSIFDRDWKAGISLEEGIQIIKKCVHELNTRFLMNQTKFSFKVVDKDGPRIIEI